MRRFLLVLCLCMLALTPLASADFTNVIANQSTVGSLWINATTINSGYSSSYAEAVAICAHYGKNTSSNDPTNYGNNQHILFSAKSAASWGASETAMENNWANVATFVMYYPGPQYISSARTALCNNSRWYVMTTHPYYNTTPIVFANFTATPLQGAVPLPVTFIDTSTNATAWNWSVSPAAGVAIDSPTSADTVMHFGTVGNYTIIHGASNGASSDIETKTNYIWVYNNTALTTTEFVAIDATTGFGINNVNISLFDVQNGTWTNTTNAPFGRATISTLAGHTINAYADTLGYSGQDLLGSIARSAPPYYIQMFPTGGTTNLSAGMVTLYITVRESPGANPIAGATIYGGGEGYGVLVNSSPWTLTTNEAGRAWVVVPNKTNIHYTASKVNYQTVSQVTYSGTGSGGDAAVQATVMLSRLTVTPTITATTGPGGTVPPTVATQDPAGKPGDPGYSNNKGQQMMDLLALFGPDLVLLCILVTIMGLMGIRLGK